MPRRGEHPRQAQWRVGIPGTRTPVSVVFDNLEVGASISEIMDWFHLSREQIVTVIEFAARSLDAPLPSQPFAQPADAHTV